MYKIKAQDLEISNREHKVNLNIFKEGEKVADKRFTCSFNQFKNKRTKLFISAAMIELEFNGLEDFAEDYNVSDFKKDGRVELIEDFEDPYN